MGMAGKTQRSVLYAFLSLHNIVYIIFCHKFQKGSFFEIHLAESGKLRYIISTNLFYAVAHLHPCLRWTGGCFLIYLSNLPAFAKTCISCLPLS